MTTSKNQYDLVIVNGRVIDPESSLDAVRNIGILGGRVEMLSEGGLDGAETIDARGLIVAPGFIDLNTHMHDDENYRSLAMDGVTTTFALEAGTADIDAWYGQREGKARINFGASIGHIQVRMKVMGDPGGITPVADGGHKAASKEEVATIRAMIEQGLASGAPAVGMGIQYTPAASHWEILEVFREAAAFGASCFVHLRYAGTDEPYSAVAALEEVLAAAAITGAGLHMTHVHSTGLKDAPRLLEMIGEARDRGLDVTGDFYPYTVAMTFIDSPLFDEGWREMHDIGYEDLVMVETGERLTEERFAHYRNVGGAVAIHSMKEEIVREVIASPLTMAATDGFLKDGKGHPRAAGTFSRILGHYTREAGVLSWTEAIRKISLMPAQRLEKRVEAMRRKGRIRIGGDADLTIFDPEAVIDRATFKQPGRYSEGMAYVLVGGVAVVREGVLVEGVVPGRGVRAG